MVSFANILKMFAGVNNSAIDSVMVWTHSARILNKSSKKLYFIRVFELSYYEKLRSKNSVLEDE